MNVLGTVYKRDMVLIYNLDDELPIFAIIKYIFVDDFKEVTFYVAMLHTIKYN